MSAERVADRFRRVYAEDAAAGRVRALASYQRMFKGFEEVVAREFAALAASTADAQAPASGGNRAAPVGVAVAAEAADAVGRGTGGAPDRDGATASAFAELLARLAAGARPAYGGRAEIARGGMGAVLRVRDDVLARDLAMKVILDGVGTPGGGSRTDRFVTEARVTAHLDHPGVVPIHELGVDADGRIYFTMKLVVGRTLAQILDVVRRGTDAHWTTPRVLALLIRVCDTLAFAHSRGVIHRDVKPANVMVGDFGEVYVMDWGLAKVLGEADGPHPRGAAASCRAAATAFAGATQNLTQEGSVLGTAGYISPEQARGRLDELDARADVFAVGAILYELLTGAAPYAGPDGRVDPRAAILAVLAGPPAPIRGRDVPEELVAITEKAMAREPADRYPDAAALSSDLADFVEGRVVRAYRTGPFVEMVKWTTRNRALASAIGAAFVLLVVGLATNLSLLDESRRETARATEQVYRSSMTSAAAALRDHDAIAAQSRLSGLGAAASRWEHRVLAARFDESAGKLPGPAACFDPEGRLLVVRRDGVLVRMADAGAPEEVLLDARPRRVLRPSPDGRWAVVGTQRDDAPWRDRAVVATADGREVLRIPDAYWDYLSFHGGRPWVYWADSDYFVHVHDLAAGRETARRAFPVKPHVFEVGHVRGRESEGDGVLAIATGDEGEVVQFVDARTLEPIARLAEHTESATVCLSPAAGFACTASLDDTVRAWDVREISAPRRTWTLRGLSDPLGVALSPDGATVAVAPVDGTLRLLDARTSESRVVLQGPPRAVIAAERSRLPLVAYSPAGDRVVTLGGLDAVLWDAAAFDDARVLRGHASFVYDLEFSPDGTLLASAGWDGFVAKPGGLRVWDVASGELVASAGVSSVLYQNVAWSADGTRVQAGGPLRDSAMRIVTCLDVATARPAASPPGTGTEVCFSPSGDRALTSELVGERSRLRIVDRESGDVVATGPIVSGAKMESSFLGTDLVAYAADDPTIHVRDARTLAPRFELRGHTGIPWSAARSPDGARLVTAADDGTARVWDARTGAPIAILPGHGTGALCAEYSRDGRLIAVGGRDRRVHLWDAATHEEIVTFSGHTNYVKGVAFSPDGEILASASGDGTIRIWSPESVGVRLAARRERRRLVEDLRPRVAALLDAPGEFESVASAAVASIRADTSLAPRARQVALQLIFAECLERRGLAAAPDGK